MNYREMLQAAEAVKETVLRDAFAMSALQGMLARTNSSPLDFPKTREGYAKAAYAMADEMIKARAE